jgi:hypothetical protein
MKDNHFSNYLLSKNVKTIKKINEKENNFYYLINIKFGLYLLFLNFLKYIYYLLFFIRRINKIEEFNGLSLKIFILKNVFKK